MTAGPGPDVAAGRVPAGGQVPAAGRIPAGGLARFRRPVSPPVPGERCEMCGELLAADHSHVADLIGRTVQCACRSCYLLFTRPGAAQGRYRAIPDRYRYDPGFRISAGQWDELAIPVDLVFVFRQSTQDREVAFYPSPGGATESLLPLGTWAEIMAANPAFADAEPDVEAVLLRRTEAGIEGYLVGIDACYDLVGRVRLHWRGFAGGEELWREVDEFFARLVERAELVEPAEPAEDGA